MIFTDACFGMLCIFLYVCSQIACYYVNVVCCYCILKYGEPSGYTKVDFQSLGSGFELEST